MKSFLINAALAGAAILVCLAALELGLRIAWTNPADYAHATDESLFWRYDSLLGWAMEPNRRGEFIRPEFHTTVTTNRYGLRDDDFPREKAENEIRVLLLGDSVVAGFEVERDSTLEARLERRLNARNDGHSYQVINAGFRGYGTDQEFLFLKNRGLDLQPDIVLMAFVPANDLENNVTVHTAGRKFAKPCFVFSKTGELQLFGIPVPDPPPVGQVYSPLLPLVAAANETAPTEPGLLSRVRAWMSRHSYTYAFVAARLKTLPPEVVAWLQRRGILHANVPESYVDFYRRPLPAEWRIRWRLTLALIEKISQLCRDHGIGFALWMFPLKEQVYARDRRIFLETYGLDPSHYDFDQPERILQEFAAGAGIRFIPTLERFRSAARRGKRFHYRTDNHFNAAGHRLMAEILLPRVEELIPAK